jgi:transposase-like protein
MSTHRSFSPQFRLQVVQQIISGEMCRTQICREYALAPRVVGRWKAAYLQQGEQAFRSQRATVDELNVQQRLNELERLCGRLSLENELLKKPWARAAFRCRAPAGDHASTCQGNGALGTAHVPGVGRQSGLVLCPPAAQHGDRSGAG